MCMDPKALTKELAITQRLLTDARLSFSIDADVEVCQWRVKVLGDAIEELLGNLLGVAILEKIPADNPAGWDWRVTPDLDALAHSFM